MRRREFLTYTATVVGAALLAGCQIDTRTPLRTSDIVAVAKSGAAVPVNVAIGAVFASETWCQDESVMALQQLSTPQVPVRLLGCRKSGNRATGQFALTTTLVRTAGGANGAAVAGEVLAGDIAKFAVFPHGKHKGLLSVGLFLDVIRLQTIKQKLVAMPVFKRGLYKGAVGLSFTVEVVNDLPHPVKFYLADVSAGGDLPADDAVLTIPPGGSDTVTLAAATQQQLADQGWVNFFVMAKR